VPSWLIWIIAAAALAAAEALSLDLVLIMCAAGAGAAAVSAVALGAAGQVAVAIATSIALLALVRPVAQRHLTGHGSTPMGIEALVGREAVVLQTVDAHDGRVRLNGAEWSARTFDQTQVIGVGISVRVMDIKGATAVVWHGP
jgi:membrane protein implicated in regulation of membrane protease activity